MSESNFLYTNQWNIKEPRKSQDIPSIISVLAPTIFSVHFQSPDKGMNCAPDAFTNSLRDFNSALNGKVDSKTPKWLEQAAIEYIDSILEKYFVSAVQEGRPQEEVFNALEPWLKNATAEIKTERFSDQYVNILYESIQKQADCHGAKTDYEESIKNGPK